MRIYLLYLFVFFQTSFVSGQDCKMNETLGLAIQSASLIRLNLIELDSLWNLENPFYFSSHLLDSSLRKYEDDLRVIGSRIVECLYLIKECDTEEIQEIIGITLHISLTISHLGQCRGVLAHLKNEYKYCLFDNYLVYAISEIDRFILKLSRYWSPRLELNIKN